MGRMRPCLFPSLISGTWSSEAGAFVPDQQAGRYTWPRASQQMTGLENTGLYTSHQRTGLVHTQDCVPAIRGEGL